MSSSINKVPQNYICPSAADSVNKLMPSTQEEEDEELKNGL
jgi:hypothetical protein